MTDFTNAPTHHPFLIAPTRGKDWSDENYERVVAACERSRGTEDSDKARKELFDVISARMAIQFTYGTTDSVRVEEMRQRDLELKRLQAETRRRIDAGPSFMLPAIILMLAIFLPPLLLR